MSTVKETKEGKHFMIKRVWSNAKRMYGNEKKFGHEEIRLDNGESFRTTESKPKDCFWALEDAVFGVHISPVPSFGLLPSRF